MSLPSARTFLGTFFHTPSYGKVECLANALVETDDSGTITSVTLPADEGYAERECAAREAGTLVEVGEGKVGLPGFVDLHVHAPQWPQSGIALDEPLNVWLDKRTFPLESKYADLEFARRVYADLVHQLLARGTTTCMYFGTVHVEPTVELARQCATQGQRGLVGKVVMDDPAGNPSFYRDASTASALTDTERFVGMVDALRPGCAQGVWPVVTPRFIPSCTDEGLAGLGRIANESGAFVQSHCNEGQWEHDFVFERFGKSDAEALYDYGLLREKSVMAHCAFLTKADGRLFAESGAAVAHCPISNAYFANSVAPVRRLRAQGVRMGLATDISGGFSPSMYDNIRQAVMVSRVREDGVDALVAQDERGAGESRISSVEALWLATAGGAEALRLPVGSFEPGRAFDAQVIDTRRPDADLTGFGVFDGPRDVLDRVLYLSVPENIRQVWVQGALVLDKDEAR